MVYKQYFKRLIDLIFAIILSIVLLPIYIIIAISIGISSGLPILYKQIRVGQYGKKFVIYKFRTMINGADKFGTSTIYGDSRITKIGNILRKTSLDELPQLINIIKGEMSFIGFRPDVPRETDDFTEKKWMLKPGITGSAQVNGRSQITIEERRNLENEYTDKASFGFDIKILVRTVGAVLKREGIY